MGAIAIALITQNDRTSLWTFVVPAGLATLLLFSCWVCCLLVSCVPTNVPTLPVFSVLPSVLLPTHQVLGLLRLSGTHSHSGGSGHLCVLRDSGQLCHHSQVLLLLAHNCKSMVILLFQCSIWHGIVALALLFAIPSMPSTNKTEQNGEEDDERVHFMSSSSSSGAGSGKGTTNKSNPETYYELIGEEASHLARSHPQGVPASAKHLTKTY